MMNWWTINNELVPSCGEINGKMAKRKKKKKGELRKKKKGGCERNGWTINDELVPNCWFINENDELLTHKWWTDEQSTTNWCLILNDKLLSCQCLFDSLSWREGSGGGGRPPSLMMVKWWNVGQSTMTWPIWVVFTNPAVFVPNTFRPARDWCVDDAEGLDDVCLEQTPFLLKKTGFLKKVFGTWSTILFDAW